MDRKLVYGLAGLVGIGVIVTAIKFFSEEDSEDSSSIQAVEDTIDYLASLEDQSPALD